MNPHRRQRYCQDPHLPLPHVVCGRTVLFHQHMTSPGHWWFQWVAFGMGIGLVVAWARALRILGVAALTAGIALLVYRWFRRRQAATR